MKSLPSYKRIWQVAWPLMVGLIAENLVGVIDTAFLGHVGELELGAVAIASTYYIVLFMVGMGFGTGTQILIGRRNGEKNYAKIGGILENSLYFIWVFSALIVLFSFIFSRQILGMIISSPEIVDAATRFINIRIFTLFFSLGCVMMRSFFVGITVTKYIGLGAFVIAITNFILDYILIFGHFGFPKMGLEGAALASVLAEVAGLVYFVIIIVKKIDYRKYRLFRFHKPNWAITKHTFNLSIFTMLQNLISLSGWFLFFVILEKTGAKNLAACTIIRSYYILIITPMWAYSASVSTLVSNAIGAGQRRYVMQIVRRVTLFSLVSAVLLLLPSFLLPQEIMGLYTPDQELIDIGFKAFYMVAIANILYTLSGIAFAAISATGNTMMALMVEIVTMVFYVASIAYLAHHFAHRLEIVWCSELVYYAVLGIGSWWYLQTNHWRKKEI